MDSLPAELIEAIGQYLDGPSLCSSLRVCRFWFNALSPLIWSYISKTQWHRTGFPIRQVFDAYDDSPLRPKLLQVRHLEWAANSDLKDVSAITIRKEIARSRLVQLLRMAANIRSLELQMSITADELGLLQSIAELRHLRRLRIEATGLDMFAIRLQDMSNTFSNLETLESTGHWLYIDLSSWERPQDAPQWRMERLSVGYYALPILWHCENLRELEIRIFESFGFQRSEKRSLRPLQTCRNLEVLKIHRYSRQDTLLDLVETIGTLRQLRSLSFSILAFSFFDLLCRPGSIVPAENDHRCKKRQQTENKLEQVEEGSGYSSARPPDDDDSADLPLPLLEDLTIISVDVGDNTFSAIDRLAAQFFNILRTRPLLKGFQIQGFSFSPSDIFAQPGQELEHGWACLGLETLKLQFKSLDPRKMNSREKRYRIWQPIYRQLGQLTKLKSLMIQCWSLEKSTDVGILELAQPISSVGPVSGEGHGRSSRALNKPSTDHALPSKLKARLTELNSLYLSDSKGMTWSRTELEILLALFPKLKDLNLRPLNPGNGKEIQKWLKEWKRTDLKFVY
ncbi:hypothetical protein BG015_005571 [Linnemannia schmuckeri]|uniref:F-box domain-containing protein n=1 Tax=Linnemannia schmuckeri TaxID=64567 RepID=A0A9P5S477_9FUNG|nr:hypothetical protein BG015_005571 [Linnemannia schmuckeri]